MPKSAIIISTHHRVVIAIHKEVLVIQPICGQYSIRAISIDEPAHFGIIIAVGQVIELGFGIIIVSTVPQRVDFSQAAAGGNELAPGVVFVGGKHIAVDVLNAGDVALLGGHVVAGHIGAAGRVIPEANRRSFVVIEEEKLVAVPLLPNQLIASVGVMVSNTIHCLGGPQAVAV